MWPQSIFYHIYIIMVIVDLVNTFIGLAVKEVISKFSTKNPPFGGLDVILRSSPGLDPLSRGRTPSIVGAELFHYSVRNGKRWCQLALKTEASTQNYIFKELKCSLTRKRRKIFIVYSRPLVLVSLMHYCTSTASLSTS